MPDISNLYNWPENKEQKRGSTDSKLRASNRASTISYKASRDCFARKAILFVCKRIWNCPWIKKGKQSKAAISETMILLIHLPANWIYCAPSLQAIQVQCKWHDWQYMSLDKHRTLRINITLLVRKNKDKPIIKWNEKIHSGYQTLLIIPIDYSSGTVHNPPPTTPFCIHFFGLIHLMRRPMQESLFCWNLHSLAPVGTDYPRMEEVCKFGPRLAFDLHLLTWSSWIDPPNP